MLLGDFPGVWRGTETAATAITEAKVGEDTYMFRPVYRKRPPAPLSTGKQRPTTISDNSGWASYVYKG